MFVGLQLWLLSAYYQRSEQREMSCLDTNLSSAWRQHSAEQSQHCFCSLRHHWSCFLQSAGPPIEPVCHLQISNLAPVDSHQAAQQGRGQISVSYCVLLSSPSADRTGKLNNLTWFFICCETRLLNWDRLWIYISWICISGYENVTHLHLLIFFSWQKLASISFFSKCVHLN